MYILRLFARRGETPSGATHGGFQDKIEMQHILRLPTLPRAGEPEAKGLLQWDSTAFSVLIIQTAIGCRDRSRTETASFFANKDSKDNENKDLSQFECSF